MNNTNNTNANTELKQVEPVISNQITIDAGIKYQEIDNFGASGSWSFDHIGEEWTEENKSKIADLLFSTDKGIGLSCLRFNIGAGSIATDKEIIPEIYSWRRAETFKASEDGQYDWTRHAGQQWFLKAAKARGVDQFVAMVYSPPVWMTKNGHAEPDYSVGTTNLKDNYLEKFAEYIVDIVRHFKDDEGILFDYISPVNEPNWEWNKSTNESNRYSNDDLKNVVNLLYKKLQEQQLDSKIIIPEAGELLALMDDEFYRKFVYDDNASYKGQELDKKYGGKYNEYLKDFLGESQYKQKVSNMICAHSYFSDISNKVEDRLIRLREVLKENLDKYNAKYWQTEYCILTENGNGRDTGMETALLVSRVIHYDLTILNASAWQWWLAVSPHDYKDGLIYTDYTVNKKQNIIPSKLLWAFGNYSRFIRPGSKRIDLVGANDKDGLMGSAYIDEANKKLITVFINFSRDNKALKCDIRNLPSDNRLVSVTPYLTSGLVGEDLKEMPHVSMDSIIDIPGRSVITLVGEY